LDWRYPLVPEGLEMCVALSCFKRFDKLYVYTWSQYTDEELTTLPQTGIQVVADVYDSNETMLAKLQAGGGGLTVSSIRVTMVRRMELDLLSQLEQARLSSLNNLFPRFQNPD